MDEDSAEQNSKRLEKFFSGESLFCFASLLPLPLVEEPRRLSLQLLQPRVCLSAIDEFFTVRYKTLSQP